MQLEKEDEEGGEEEVAFVKQRQCGWSCGAAAAAGSGGKVLLSTCSRPRSG